MCSLITTKVHSSSQGQQFNCMDINQSTLPHALTVKEVQKEIHVIDSDGKIYKNATAILKILDPYPQFRFLVYFGKLPIIRQLLVIGYKFVSHNRHFIFGPASRIYWLKITLALAFFIGFLLSPKLWLTTRFYPLSPIAHHWPTIPYPIDYMFFITLLAFLILILLKAKVQKYIVLFILLTSIIMLGDQTRWQPWAYQYLAMFFVLSFYSWNNPAEIQRERKILNTVRVIVAGTYMFSGLQKLNVSFIHQVYPWLIGPITHLMPVSLSQALLPLGVLLPLLEFSIGFGLLTKRFRNIALIAALFMHVFILFTLGPFGHRWNSVVWPWNIAMMLFVLILFYRVKDVHFKEILFQKRLAVHYLIVVLFLVMPLFSFVNHWDSYLSAALYSGNTVSASLSVDDSAESRLSTSVQKSYTYKIAENRNMVDLFSWSFGELNVPPYPEERVYKNIARHFCKDISGGHTTTLDVAGRPNWLTGNREHKIYDCSSL